MKRFKVLFITERYPNCENMLLGGPIKEYIKAAGYANDVIVMNGLCLSKRSNISLKIKDTVEDGIRVIRIPYKENSLFSISYFAYLHKLCALFRKILNEGFMPDLIHAHIYYSGIAALLLAKPHHIPVVITEHNSAFIRRNLSSFELFKARFVFSKVNAVFPVSLALKEALESYGIRNSFMVTALPVDTGLFAPAETKDSVKTKRVLYVGALISLKGIAYLIAAVNEIAKKRSDFNLDIVGIGSLLNGYKKQVDYLGLNDRVTFHGLKTREQVAKFMQDSDFFVLPSLCETFSCAILEAISSGLPIVSSRVGAIPELVNEKRGILVPPCDTPALVRALEYMLDNYKEYSGRESHIYAVDKYSYETVGNVLNYSYSEILKNVGKVY